MFVDSHCHLDRLKLNVYDQSLDAAIEAASENNVQAMLCVCISDENRHQVISIAEKYPHICASVGVHPCDVSEEALSAEQLISWVAESKKVVAVGETGLDYYHSQAFVEQQKKSFEVHLQVGAELNLPVIVHTRNAREDTIDLIREHGSEESSGVLHCFTESWEMAKQALDMNYYISLSGIVTFKNTHELKDIAKKIPADRLLIETDSPYLAPVPFRGKPNEPKYVKYVGEYLAGLRGVSVEELAATTTENYYRLFHGAQSFRP